MQLVIKTYLIYELILFLLQLEIWLKETTEKSEKKTEFITQLFLHIYFWPNKTPFLYLFLNGYPSKCSRKFPKN